ncbi:adhesion G protein-coupled receptor L3-like [Anneissia japonica]|uniref:adhesion G protein-coupled receptor L3-like n=1 Tax=Anneissia japonica TaxID=1529436 RepID=UPI001425A2EE|nr:adhesion G protein-coupled receptor L3-like [Anneissia japonica]
MYGDDMHVLGNITIIQMCIMVNNVTIPSESKDCHGLDFNMNRLNDVKLNESYIITDKNKTVIIPESHYRIEIALKAENIPTNLNNVRITSCLSQTPDPTCPRIALSTSDFTVINNTIWIYKNNGRKFTNDDIMIISNETVLVCSFLSQNGTNTDLSTLFIYDTTLHLLDIVGVSLSLLGLFLTFAIRCIYKELRTTSGKIVMNIAASLFLAQLGTLFSKSLVEYTQACFLMAALLHYLWLVAFVWMLMMSILLFRSFRSLKSAVANRKKKQSVKLHLFCCWGLPLLFVAILLTLHFCDRVPIQFSYGDETVCWIRDEFAAFLFLGIPMATILCLNSIMFVVIVRGIYQNTRSSRAIRRNSIKEEFTSNLIIFIKISCIMGLTWIFGFLASFTDEPYIWYIFVIFNSLQGVFIFMAFTLSSLMKVLFGKKKKAGTT